MWTKNHNHASNCFLPKQSEVNRCTFEPTPEIRYTPSSSKPKYTAIASKVTQFKHHKLTLEEWTLIEWLRNVGKQWRETKREREGGGGGGGEEEGEEEEEEREVHFALDQLTFGFHSFNALLYEHHLRFWRNHCKEKCQTDVLLINAKGTCKLNLQVTCWDRLPIPSSGKNDLFLMMAWVICAKTSRLL